MSGPFWRSSRLISRGPQLAVCLILHWLTGGIGICMTYHRLLTHRSFTLWPRWLEYPLTILGNDGLRGGRDRLGRRPSPAPRVLGRRERHAHARCRASSGPTWVGGCVSTTAPGTRRSTTRSGRPTCYKDPVHRWIDSYHIIFPIALMGLLYYLGGMSWLIWGGFLRTILVLHTTWLVNSASHIWGYRSHPTRDKSTNLWWVALLTYGEGWHNNHHAFQTSARHGLDWWEIDMTYLTIKLLSLFGLAGNIKLPKITRADQSRILGAAADERRRRVARGRSDPVRAHRGVTREPGLLGVSTVEPPASSGLEPGGFACVESRIRASIRPRPLRGALVFGAGNDEDERAVLLAALAQRQSRGLIRIKGGTEG